MGDEAEHDMADYYFAWGAGELKEAEVSRLSHEYPDQPELWQAEHHEDAHYFGPEPIWGDAVQPRHIASVLRDIMHEQTAFRGITLCAFCGVKPSTHTLIVDTPDEWTGIPVECCDGCDDMEPSDLPIV